MNYVCRIKTIISKSNIKSTDVQFIIEIKQPSEIGVNTSVIIPLDYFAK